MSGPIAALLVTGDTGEPVRFRAGAPGEKQHQQDGDEPQTAPKAWKRL